MIDYEENLRRNCGFQRAIEKGLSNYPYGEHLQDCDICQGAEHIKHLGEENQELRNMIIDIKAAGRYLISEVERDHELGRLSVDSEDAAKNFKEKMK